MPYGPWGGLWGWGGDCLHVPLLCHGESPKPPRSAWPMGRGTPQWGGCGDPASVSQRLFTQVPIPLPAVGRWVPRRDVGVLWACDIWDLGRVRGQGGSMEHLQGAGMGGCWSQGRAAYPCCIMGAGQQRPPGPAQLPSRGSPQTGGRELVGRGPIPGDVKAGVGLAPCHCGQLGLLLHGSLLPLCAGTGWWSHRRSVSL